MKEVRPGLSRRALLKTGLVGAVVLGVGSVGLALRHTRPLAQIPELTVLDAKEFAILHAIAERVCPPLGTGAPGATALNVAQGFDAMLATLDVGSQKATKIALHVFESALTGALTGERLTPFTELAPEEQDRVLERWRTSRISFRRTVYRGLTTGLMALYWGDPRTWERIGYDGPPNMKELREVYAEELVDLDALRGSPVAKGS